MRSWAKTFRLVIILFCICILGCGTNNTYLKAVFVHRSIPVLDTVNSGIKNLGEWATASPDIYNRYSLIRFSVSVDDIFRLPNNSDPSYHLFFPKQQNFAERERKDGIIEVDVEESRLQECIESKSRALCELKKLDLSINGKFLDLSKHTLFFLGYLLVYVVVENGINNIELTTNDKIYKRALEIKTDNKFLIPWVNRDIKIKDISVEVYISINPSQKEYKEKYFAYDLPYEMVVDPFGFHQGKRKR